VLHFKILLQHSKVKVQIAFAHTNVPGLLLDSKPAVHGLKALQVGILQHEASVQAVPQIDALSAFFVIAPGHAP
jgi:hypothetical protein